MNGQWELSGHTPDLFPLGFDARNDAVTFIRLSRSDYSRASFLDARILTPQTATRTMPWRQVADAIETAKLTERCDFIFHIGHVGSTLISRLAGAHPALLSLREPQVLRTFAQLQGAPGPADPAWNPGELEERLGGCLKLLSRTFGTQQKSLIKATSFVSELAVDLLSRTSSPKALMICVSPETYLATILGGSNSRQEATWLTPSRLRRLHRRLGRDPWRAESLSEGERLALGWACEMSALVAATRAAGERALPLNFDRFLANPPELLGGILHHLGIETTAADVNAILGGPDMRRYSKAPEHGYDAALRLAVLTEARAAHGAEISKGLAWLERAAVEFPPVRDAVLFVGQSAHRGAALDRR